MLGPPFYSNRPVNKMRQFIKSEKKSAHSFSKFTRCAQFKGNFFHQQVKGAIVWWKILIFYSNWDKSQREQHRSKVAHICCGVKDHRIQPWNKSCAALLFKLRFFSLFGFFTQTVLNEQMLRCRAFICFSTFLSISSGMVSRLTPRLQAVFFLFFFWT